MSQYLSTNPFFGLLDSHRQGISRFPQIGVVFLTFKQFVPPSRKHKFFCIPSGSFLSVNRLSLQSGKVCSGKLERTTSIFPSINFSTEFSRIHAKETYKSFDPTKVKCCKLVQQRRKTRSSTFQALSFLRIFQQKRPMKNDALAN